jgi:hypothetical protein
MAVTTHAQRFQLGIKAGADIDKISGASFKNEFAYGYHLGGFANIGLGKKVSLQPELYYSTANMKHDTSLNSIYTSVDPSKIKFGYLNIPILLNIKAGEKLSIIAGPKFGILSNSTLSVKSNAQNAFKNGDLAVVAGLQLNFTGIYIYGRYQVGVTNINDVVDQEKWSRQTIHVGVALKII